MAALIASFKVEVVRRPDKETEETRDPDKEEG
jgi:hypothetical protein